MAGEGSFVFPTAFCPPPSAHYLSLLSGVLFSLFPTSHILFATPFLW